MRQFFSTHWLRENKIVLLVSFVLSLFIPAIAYFYPRPDIQQDKKIRLISAVFKQDAPSQQSTQYNDSSIRGEVIRYEQESKQVNVTKAEHDAEPTPDNNQDSAPGTPLIQTEMLARTTSSASETSETKKPSSKPSPVEVTINTLALQNILMMRQKLLIEKKAHDIKVLEELRQLTHEKYYQQLLKHAKQDYKVRKKTLEKTESLYAKALGEFCDRLRQQTEQNATTLPSLTSKELNKHASSKFMKDINACINPLTPAKTDTDTTGFNTEIKE